MWLLHFIPDSWLEYAIFFVMATGTLTLIAGYTIKLVPFLSKYSTPIQLSGTLILCLSLYLIGGYGVETEWRKKVHDLEERIRVSENLSREANTEIQTKVVTKIKTVRDTKIVIEEKIKEIEKRIDSECKVDKEAIQILNQAASLNIGVKK